MHYSKAEASPVGIGTTLYDKLGPYKISPFFDRVLQVKITFQDLEDIPMMETVELLKSTVEPQIKQKTIHSYPTNTLAEIHIYIDSEDYKKMFSK